MSNLLVLPAVPLTVPLNDFEPIFIVTTVPGFAFSTVNVAVDLIDVGFLGNVTDGTYRNAEVVLPVVAVSRTVTVYTPVLVGFKVLAAVPVIDCTVAFVVPQVIVTAPGLAFVTFAVKTVPGLTIPADVKLTAMFWPGGYACEVAGNIIATTRGSAMATLENFIFKLFLRPEAYSKMIPHTLK